VFPLSGFRLYDDLVIVESIVGEQQLAEADDVARYEKYLELLREAASTGTEAAAVIRRSLERPFTVTLVTDDNTDVRYRIERVR